MVSHALINRCLPVRGAEVAFIFLTLAVVAGRRLFDPKLLIGYLYTKSQLPVPLLEGIQVPSEGR